MVSDIIYRYTPEANPERQFMPGVPLRDLTQADLDRLPDHVRRGIARCPFYEAAMATPRVRPGPRETKVRGPSETKTETEVSDG